MKISIQENAFEYVSQMSGFGSGPSGLILLNVFPDVQTYSRVKHIV